MNEMNECQYYSRLYTTQDYIQDLLATIRDKDYYIQQLNDNNNELTQRLKDSKNENKELVFYKMSHDHLEQKIIDLQKCNNDLQMQLRLRSDAIPEEIAFCATEADGKPEVTPSIVVMQNTISDQLFSVDCETSDPQLDDNFINLTEMMTNNDLPKKFALITIEWKILPMSLIDVNNKKLLDINKWGLKENTIINVIPVEGHPFRPKANKILKIAFDGMIDFESVQNSLKESKDVMIDKSDEFEDLVKHFDYMQSFNENNKNNLSASKSDQQMTIESAQNNDQMISEFQNKWFNKSLFGDLFQSQTPSTSSASDERIVNKEEEDYLNSGDHQNKGSTFPPLSELLNSETIENNDNNSIEQNIMREWRAIIGKPHSSLPQSINDLESSSISDEEIYFDD